jgi:hypothetical protein
MIFRINETYKFQVGILSIEPVDVKRRDAISKKALDNVCPGIRYVDLIWNVCCVKIISQFSSIGVNPNMRVLTYVSLIIR